MTGSELIEWIKEHHAEQMKAIVQYRDEGGLYSGGEDARPCLCVIKGSDIPYDDSYEINYRATHEPNAFSL